MKKAGIMMIAGSLLLLGLYFFPLWNIMLFAPQYPDPLGLDIYINGLKGVKEFDIQNIDGLNHYIGMKTLPKNDQMWEFTAFPYIIGGMIALGVLIGLLGYLGKVSYKWFMGWFILMSVLGVLGMYDFNAWLVDYGSDLDPNAIMAYKDEFGNPMKYNPPLIGHKTLLNFDVDSFPSTGAWMMFIGMMIVFASYFVGKRENVKK
ncbi:MAG: hypothetical protein WDA08_01655 [Weeksellaceae bacterium]